MIRLYFLSSLLFVLIVLHSCNEDCCRVSTESCDNEILVVCDSNSLDLIRYVKRSGGQFDSGTAQAIKSIPEVGETYWIPNCALAEASPHNYYLSLSTYADTSWVGLEVWAFSRDVLLTKFDPFLVGVQKVYDRSSYDEDSTLSFSTYIKWHNDLFDAQWQIDLSKENYINVTNIDYENLIFEGEFDFHFRMTIQSRMPNVIYSESLRFRCGKFRAKLLD